MALYFIMNYFERWLRPHPLRSHTRHAFRVGFFLAIVGCAALLSGSYLVHHISTRHQSYLAAVLPSVLVDLANEDRVRNGVGELTENPLLKKAAEEKAKDMALRGYFSHTSPDGKDPWYWFDRVGYTYHAAGENLAVHFTDSLAINSAWMASPSHRANIVNGEFTEIGIGVAIGEFEGEETIFVVQMFGRPSYDSYESASGHVVLARQIVSSGSDEGPVSSHESVSLVTGGSGDGSEDIASSDSALPVISVLEPQDQSAQKRKLPSPRRVTPEPLRIFGTLIAFLAGCIAVPLFISAHQKERHARVAHVGAGIFVFLIAIGVYAVTRSFAFTRGETTETAAVIFISHD